MCIIFKSIDVLQLPHRSYLQNGYFFCVHVVAKKKLLVIRIFVNKQQKSTKKICLFFSLMQGNLSRQKKTEPPRYSWHIAETDIVNTIKQTNKHQNGGNVRFVKRNYEIFYKENPQWHDTFWHACNYMHVNFDWPRKKPTLNSCYSVQFSISWQYLTSKLQKVQEFQI